MTDKQSIAGTKPVPLEPDVLAKENRKEDEFEAMRNDPELQRSIAEREEKEADRVKEGNSLEEDSGKIRTGRKVQRDNLPPEIKKSYIEIDGKYYFAGRPESLAFEDKGGRLRTRLSHGNVAGSMVDMAKAKGWTEIRVKGKEEFRREAWLHAVSKGLAVRGYSPRDEDLARLKKLIREQPEDETGDRHADGRHEGLDKEQEKQPAPVSQSAAQEERKERTVNHAKALQDKQQDLVKLARENPELVNEIAAIKMGEKLSRNITSDADRQRFMALVRERVADNHLKGQGLQPIKIREERTIERPDREKEMQHER